MGDNVSVVLRGARTALTVGAFILALGVGIPDLAAGDSERIPARHEEMGGGKLGGALELDAGYLHIMPGGCLDPRNLHAVYDEKVHDASTAGCVPMAITDAHFRLQNDSEKAEGRRLKHSVAISRDGRTRGRSGLLCGAPSFVAFE